MELDCQKLSNGKLLIVISLGLLIHSKAEDMCIIELDNKLKKLIIHPFFNFQFYISFLSSSLIFLIFFVSIDFSAVKK